MGDLVTNSYHPYFLRISNVWSKLYNVSMESAKLRALHAHVP